MDNRSKGIFSLFFSNHKGFSLVGLLMAGGLLAGLSLVVAQLTKQQVANDKKAETGVEIVALSERILRTLYDGDACLNTMRLGTPPELPVIVPGANMSMSAIRSRTNRDVIVTGNTYGNRLVKVTSMTLRVDSGSIASNQAEAEVRVIINRESRAFTGPRTVLKIFPVMLNLDASDRVIGCVSNASAVTDTVAERWCQNIEGPTAWDPATRVCNITNCPAGQFLEGFNASGKICRLAVADTTCPSGQVVVSFANGVPTCGLVGSPPPPPPPDCQWFSRINCPPSHPRLRRRRPARNRIITRNRTAFDRSLCDRELAGINFALTQEQVCAASLVVADCETRVPGIIGHAIWGTGYIGGGGRAGYCDLGESRSTALTTIPTWQCADPDPFTKLLFTTIESCCECEIRSAQIRCCEPLP